MVIVAVVNVVVFGAMIHFAIAMMNSIGSSDSYIPNPATVTATTKAR
jgi:hypothetical protein